MHLNRYFSVAINVYLSREVCMRAHIIYVTNKNRIFNKNFFTAGYKLLKLKYNFSY